MARRPKAPTNSKVPTLDDEIAALATKRGTFILAVETLPDPPDAPVSASISDPSQMETVARLVGVLNMLMERNAVIARMQQIDAALGFTE